MNKPTLIQIFFWTCAGSTVSVLKKLEVEQARHTVLGVAIIVVSSLAFFTGKTAFYVCFKNEGLSIIAGIAWAAIIFNLDRSFIVSTNSQSGTIKWGLFCVRLGMATLIALSISTIIELEIFKSEISSELESIFIQDIRDERIKDIRDITAQILVAKDNTKIAKEAYDNQVKESKDTNQEMRDFNPTGRDKGRTDILRREAIKSNSRKQNSFNEYKQKQNVESSLNKKLEEANSDIDTKLIRKNDKYKEIIRTLPEKSGLINRYKALKNIIERRKLESERLVFIALIAMIEISPLLLKTLYPTGKYEEMIIERSTKDKNKYVKELDFEEARFKKVIEITNGRLNLEENFADSKLHPSNLLLSNDLISNSEDSLKSNPDTKKSKNFILQTEAEKKQDNGKNKPQNSFDSIREKWDDLDNPKKLGIAASLITLLGIIGTNAQHLQAITGLWKEFISFFIK
jgi:Domain of unknown function (DUF4407)